MKKLFFCLLILFACVAQTLGTSPLKIDGVLDEEIYKQAEPLRSDTSNVYFITTADFLVLGFQVEDDGIDLSNPDEWWSGTSSVEMWIDWGNEKSTTSFDYNDEQFWFVPISGNDGRGYVGLVENLERGLEERMFDYGSQTDAIDMAFVINEGTGYTMEARINKEELTDDYIPSGTIGFGYAAIKGGSNTKHFWEGAPKLIYNQPDTWGVLTIEEVVIFDPALASEPNPRDGAMLVGNQLILSWEPGDFAVSHDVYLGDNFDDVNEATRDSDVFRINQTTTSYDAGTPGPTNPDGLVPGTTYYWRIDEVNDVHPDSPWKGYIWSFSIPPKTAYAPYPADGAVSVDPDVELSWTGGFGSTSHTVFFGDNFSDVNKATGGSSQETTTYSPPSTLNLAKTYYWRVDESDDNDMYKGEVWSFTTGGAVEDPNPSDGAVDVRHSPVLSWTPGIFAASYNLYFGTNYDDVNDADTSSPEYKVSGNIGAESYEPGKLEWNSTYYWRIDEVNDVNPDSPWKGPVWSFTTGNFIVVDDFEDYGDYPPNRIFDTWIDGWGTTTNGAIAGYPEPDFVAGEHYMEDQIIHDGLWSMPYFYDNYMKYSEAVRTLDSARNWTLDDVQELSLWFRGHSSYVGSFTEEPAGTYTMTASGTDIWGNSDEFHFAFKQLTGFNSIIAKVESIEMTDVWAKAGVMIRNTLEPDSTHAMVVVTPRQGVSFQNRTVAGMASAEVTETDITAPQWVKLELNVSGNFVGYYSSDGISWTQLGSVSINMNPPVYVGLVVTAHNPNEVCEAVFSNFNIAGTVSQELTDQDIGIVSNALQPMYVAVGNSTGEPVVIYHEDPNPTVIPVWTEWIISLQDFVDQGIDLTDVDNIAIGVGTKGDTTTLGGSGKMFFDELRLYIPREPEPER